MNCLLVYPKIFLHFFQARDILQKRRLNFVLKLEETGFMLKELMKELTRTIAVSDSYPHNCAFIKRKQG